MIHVDSISKVYFSSSGDVAALNNVSLKLNKGDIFGLIGQSGAGKSTLIRILAGLEVPSKGAIFFEGYNLALQKKEQRRLFCSKMGMIFQDFRLLSSRTAAENIAFPMELFGVPIKEQEERVDKLLSLVGLSRKKHAYPANLSGGEQQRVGIARALANNPEFLLSDEATSALDPKATEEILELLKKINQEHGVTIFLITHEMDVIRRICNKVAVMDKGAIVEQGLVSDVFFQPKAPLTRMFLQNAAHQLPAHYFQKISPERKLLRLAFKGIAAEEPVISRMIQHYGVEANILLGWIDQCQTTTIGNLIIELTGPEASISQALVYLQQQAITYEELTQ